jgi:hypothetical protein
MEMISWENSIDTANELRVEMQRIGVACGYLHREIRGRLVLDTDQDDWETIQNMRNSLSHFIMSLEERAKRIGGVNALSDLAVISGFPSINTPVSTWRPSIRWSEHAASHLHNQTPAIASYTDEEYIYYSMYGELDLDNFSVIDVSSPDMHHCGDAIIRDLCYKAFWDTLHHDFLQFPPLRGRMAILLESIQIEMGRIQITGEAADISFLDPLADVTWETRLVRFDTTVLAVTHGTNLINVEEIRLLYNKINRDAWKFRKPFLGEIYMPHSDSIRLTIQMLGFLFDLLRVIIKGITEQSIRDVQTKFPTRVQRIEYLHKEFNNKALADYAKTQAWIWDTLEQLRGETPDVIHDYSRMSEPEKDQFCRLLLISMVSKTTTNKEFITDASCPEILQLDLPTITSWWCVMRDVSDMVSILHCTLHFFEMNDALMDMETVVFIRDNILRLQGMGKYTVIKRFKDWVCDTPGTGAHLHEFLIENTTQCNGLDRWGEVGPRMIPQMKLGSFATEAYSALWGRFLDFVVESYTMPMHGNMDLVARQVATLYTPICRKFVDSFVENLIDNCIGTFTLGTHATSGNTCIQSLDGFVLSIIREHLGGKALPGADVTSM